VGVIDMGTLRLITDFFEKYRILLARAASGTMASEQKNSGRNWTVLYCPVMKGERGQFL